MPFILCESSDNGSNSPPACKAQEAHAPAGIVDRLSINDSSWCFAYSLSLLRQSNSRNKMLRGCRAAFLAAATDAASAAIILLCNFFFFFWYSTKSVQYKYYHSNSTVNSLQKNLVPRNLQPSPDKKKLLPSLRTLFTNQLPANTPRDAATRAMRGCVERVARVSDQHFFSFPTFFLKS